MRYHQIFCWYGWVVANYSDQLLKVSRCNKFNDLLNLIIASYLLSSISDTLVVYLSQSALELC